MDDTTYTIRPRPPMRALFVAALASVVGVGLLTLSNHMGWHSVVAWIGIALALAGAVLLALAIASIVRNTVQLELTARGYIWRGPTGIREGRWDSVRRVTQSRDRSHVTLVEDEGRTHLIFGSGLDPTIAEVLEDMTQRLNAARRG